MRSLRGEAPHNSRVGEGLGGRRQPSPQEMQGGLATAWGDAVPPSKINYLMSVSVRLGICFGSVGIALKPNLKPTLVGMSTESM